MKWFRPRPTPRPTTTIPATVTLPAEVDPQPGPIDTQCIAEIATGLWRLHSKMLDPATGQPLPEVRHLHRHLQITIDVLHNAGVTTQSHQGSDFDPGLALTVTAYQPVAGLDREQVLETIRPTVYLGGDVIQHGEVVVGVPLG